MKKISNNFSIDLLLPTATLLSNEELRLIMAGDSVKYGTYGVSLLDDNGSLIRYVSYGEMEKNGGNLGSDFEMALGYNPGYGSSAWGSTSSSSYMGSSFNTFNVLNECSNSMLLYMEQHNIGLVSSQCDTHNYNTGNNTIYVDNDTTFGYYEMVHEFTHAFQQNAGMTGDRIYREFQSYITSKLATVAKGYGASQIFSEWAFQIVDDNGCVDMKKFYSDLSNQFNEFQKHKDLYNNESPIGTYSNYNFRWEELFNTIGIKMKF